MIKEIYKTFFSYIIFVDFKLFFFKKNCIVFPTNILIFVAV